MKTEIYFVDVNHYKEALLTFSFRNTVNWLEEGLSLVSWNYIKVAETKKTLLEDVYDKYRQWNGNAKSKLAGHTTVTVGDIIVINGEANLIIGGGWEEIPESIWNKIIKA